MNNYKKFDLTTIRTKLKNNEYANLTGAMRAIGKTQNLSDDDKEKARKMARAHFGEPAPAASAPKTKKPAKKVAKKAATKASRKKSVKKAAPVAKKTAKKASKRAPRAKATSSEADTGETETTETAAPPPPSSETTAEPRPRSVSTPASSSASKGNVILEMGQVISTVGESLKAMEAAKRIFPKASLERDVETAAGVMTRAVKVIDQEVTQPRLGSMPPTEAPTGVRKKTSKKGTRAKTASTTSKPMTTPPPSEEHVEAGDTGDVVEGELSEEEQQQFELARQTQASTG